MYRTSRYGRASPVEELRIGSGRAREIPRRRSGRRRAGGWAMRGNDLPLASRCLAPHCTAPLSRTRATDLPVCVRTTWAVVGRSFWRAPRTTRRRGAPAISMQAIARWRDGSPDDRFPTYSALHRFPPMASSCLWGTSSRLSSMESPPSRYDTAISALPPRPDAPPRTVSAAHKGVHT